MSKTIEVDDEVFEALQARAEPLVDDANSVLRRLLDLGSAPGLEKGPRTAPRRRTGSASKRVRAPRGTLLPEAAYEVPILSILAEKPRQAAPASEVIEELGVRLNGALTDSDYEVLQSGSVRW